MTERAAERTRTPSSDVRASRVAVIIAMKDAEKTIGRALETLALQTFADFQVIVVDDCSNSSRGLEIVREYAQRLNLVEIHLDASLGVTGAKNLGVASTEAEFVAFLDADDEVAPEWLEVLVTHCVGVDIATCGYEVRRLDQARRVMEVIRSEAPGLLTDGRKLLLSGTFLARRDRFLSVGGYDSGTEPMDNLDLTLALAKAGASVMPVDQVLFFYNHSESTGKRRRYAMKQATNIVHFIHKHETYYAEHPLDAARGFDVAGTSAARLGLRSEARRLTLQAFKAGPTWKRALKLLGFTLAWRAAAKYAVARESRIVSQSSRPQ